jgi:hypothetical protein
MEFNTEKFLRVDLKKIYLYSFTRKILVNNDYAGCGLSPKRILYSILVHHYFLTDDSVDSMRHWTTKEHGILSAGPCTSSISDVYENGHDLYLQDNRNEAALSPSCAFLWISLK